MDAPNDIERELMKVTKQNPGSKPESTTLGSQRGAPQNSESGSQKNTLSMKSG
jgi:hypothetical protein